MRTFTISDEREVEVSAWLKDLREADYLSQIEHCQECKDTGRENCSYHYMEGVPYPGAIEGPVTYKFTPTSVGMGVSVHYGEQTLDISDW
jgi:hypothetical protein